MKRTKYKYYPRHLLLGFVIYTAIFVMQVSANPSVGSSINKNTDSYSITIYGKSIGSILNGDIYCEYDPQYDIDKASIRSPIAALALGASLNKTGNSLHITIAARGTVTIDSSSIAVLEIPFSGSTLNNYVFKIDSASFIDRSGAKREADVIPVSVTVPLYLIKKTDLRNSNRYFMLNGKLMPLTVVDIYKRESVGSVIPLKILYDRRRN